MKDEYDDIEINDWTKLKVESAKFLLDQAEKNLSETIAAADKLNERAVTIIKFFVPLFVGLIVYISANFELKNLITHLTIYGVVFCFIIIIMSIQAYYLYKIKPMGNSPKNMITDEYVENENQELLFVFNSLRTVQQSINYNSNEISRKAKKIKRLVFIINIGLFLPIIYLIIWQESVN